MKHIKLFENTNNTSIQYYDNMGFGKEGKIIIYGDNNQHKDILSEISDDEIGGNIEKLSNYDLVVSEFDDTALMCSIQPSDFIFYISTDGDDYFYLTLKGSGYKCDGLDSLRKLILELIEVVNQDKSVIYQLNSKLNLKNNS